MRGNPGNEVLSTTVTNTQTLHLFLLHMYSSFIVTILLDMTSHNAILYFAHFQYS